MILQSIELIKRQGGFFHFRDHYIPSLRSGNGIGVAIFFKPSQLDQDFADVLGFQPYLWFPTAKQLDDIHRALDKSDYKTFEMLRHGWGGIRPRPLKVADFM